MSKAAWFWIIFVICLLFSGFMEWPFSKRSGAWLAVFILLGLLGWAVFGDVVK